MNGKGKLKVKRYIPKFIRQESWRYKRLAKNWRRPRGLDNKVRRKVKGWPSSPNTGYRKPKRIRGLHPSNYREVMVYNIDNLGNIHPELEAIRIAHTVGARKRAEILNSARELGIHVFNPKEYRELEEPLAEGKS